MDGWMIQWMDGWIGGLMDGSMDRWFNGGMDGSIDGYMSRYLYRFAHFSSVNSSFPPIKSGIRFTRKLISIKVYKNFSSEQCSISMISKFCLNQNGSHYMSLSTC